MYIIIYTRVPRYAIEIACDTYESVYVIIILENGVVRTLNVLSRDFVYVPIYDCIMLLWCWRGTMGVLTHIRMFWHNSIFVYLTAGVICGFVHNIFIWKPVYFTWGRDVRDSMSGDIFDWIFEVGNDTTMFSTYYILGVVNCIYELLSCYFIFCFVSMVYIFSCF